MVNQTGHNLCKHEHQYEDDYAPPTRTFSQTWRLAAFICDRLQLMPTDELQVKQRLLYQSAVTVTVATHQETFSLCIN
jgi:hypothetical protein